MIEWIVLILEALFDNEEYPFWKRLLVLVFWTVLIVALFLMVKLIIESVS